MVTVGRVVAVGSIWTGWRRSTGGGVGSAGYTETRDWAMTNVTLSALYSTCEFGIHVLGIVS